MFGVPRLSETLDSVLCSKLVKAGQKVRASMWDRDELIVAAAGKGASLRAIAKAVGLSHESVRRIVAGRKEHEDAS